ncbi:unnamed protein product [Soboliphyme baturini]|uniref:4HBT domain-containing protein n=1 Tax=Soboliphyme baturini TaxID=241478 RepID=A0A183JAD2_9BILA|nr:unnamed protein product [Soboliphyme baturini]
MEQVQKFKVTFAGDVKFETEIDRRFAVASGLLHELAGIIVTNAELDLKTKISMFKSCTATVKFRSRVQAAEMGSLRRIAEITVLDKVRRSYIQKSFCVQPLLLQTDKPQL